jgi:ATP-dependent DNA ligase
MDEATKAACAAELRFHLFDLVPLFAPRREVKLTARQRKPTRIVDEPLRARRLRLEAALIDYRGGVLRLTPQFPVSSAEELDRVYAELLDLEYEGVMLKDLSAPYALDDRVPFWRKLKPQKTIELRVTGTVEGLGKHFGRLGALRCVDAQGREVSVGGGFTDAEREELWARRAEITGAEVEVRVQDCGGHLSVTARHPQFVRPGLDKSIRCAYCSQ